MEEKLVIDRLKGGDAEAFTILYNRYWLKVYNFRNFTLYLPPNCRKWFKMCF